MSSKNAVLMIAITSILIGAMMSGASASKLKDIIVENNDLGIAGDTNNDYVVDMTDIDTILDNFGSQSVSGGSESTDVNSDGKVDLYDLGTSGVNFGQSIFDYSSDPPNTNVFIDPYYMRAEPGSQFTLNVDIDTNDSIFAASTVVKYDVTKLNATGVTEGGFLTSDGKSTFHIFIINRTEGTVDCASTRMNTHDGVSGSGTLFAITFEALQEGNDDVLISEYEIVNDGLTTIESSTDNGTVWIDTNDPAQIDAISDKNVDEGQEISFTVTANDPEGDGFILTVISGPGSMTGDTYSYDAGWDTNHVDEVYTVTIESEDDYNGATDTESFQLTVNDVNRDPTIDSIANQNVDEGQVLSFGVSGTDPESDTLTYAVISGPGSFTGSTYSYTPGWDTNHDDEVYSVTVEATDGHGGSDTETFQVTVVDVDRAPSIDSYLPADMTPEMDEGESLTFSVTASDPDSDTLNYLWKLDGLQVSTTTSYTYSPSYADSGPHTVEVTVSDGHGGTDVQTWDLTVNDVSNTCTQDSDCGTDGYISSPFCDSNTLLRTYRTYTCNDPGEPTAYCSSSDSNVTQETCGYMCVIDECVSNQPPSIDSYFPTTDPTINEGESQDFSISASDMYGDSLSVMWLLDGVQVMTGDSYTFTGDYDSADTYSVVANVSDGELYATHSWMLTVLDVPIACYENSDCGTDGYVSGPFCSGLDIKRTYRTYTCNDPGVPSASCSYTDSDNTVQTCSYLCDSGSCVANDDPVITAISDKSLNEGQMMTFLITATDTHGDTVTLSKESGPGTLTDNTYTYSAPWDTNHVNEVYTVVIKADDGHGGTDTEDFQITVNDVNRAPTINSHNPTDTTPDVDEGQSLSFSVTASDPDGDTLSYLWKLDSSEVSTTTGWTYGTDYTDSGTHAVEVTVSDGHGGTDTQAWTVTVNDVTSVDMQLYDGVNNNVAIPAEPASTAIEDVLSSISGEYCIVQVYDGSWKEYIPDSRPSACLEYVSPPPWHENTLTSLDGTLPFNIRMIGDAVLTVDIV